MKGTNDRAIIRLRHLPTGRVYDWYLADHAVPSVHYLEKRIDTKREELRDKYREFGLDVEKDAISDSHLSQQQLREIEQINDEIMKLHMDRLSSILEPKHELPAEFGNKRELLEESVSSYDEIAEITGFFSRRFVNTITSPRGSGVEILDEAGNPWQENSTTGSATGTSSTGSESQSG